MAPGIGGSFLYKGIKGATDPARQAAELFVSDLEAGDADAAYGLLCSDTRGRYTRDAFVQGVAKQPKIRGHKVNGVNVEERQRPRVGDGIHDPDGWTAALPTSTYSR